MQRPSLEKFAIGTVLAGIVILVAVDTLFNPRPMAVEASSMPLRYCEKGAEHLRGRLFGGLEDARCHLGLFRTCIFTSHRQKPDALSARRYLDQI